LIRGITEMYETLSDTLVLLEKLNDLARIMREG
jgi:hypothetical protein